MRTLTKIMLTTALALTVSTSASALISVTMTQFGGTYSASVGASNGDTLVLDINFAITGASTVTLLDPLIDLGTVGITGLSALETGVSQWGSSFDSHALTRVANGDVQLVNGNTAIDGFDRTTNADLVGASAPCFSGGLACTVMGRLTLTLDGTGGVLDTGSILQPTPFGSFAAGAGGADVSGTVSWGTFTVVPVPEPTTASLLGLGLLGLTLAGRSRKN